jgi:hypothetical protein
MTSMPNARIPSPLRGRARVVALAAPVVFLGTILGGCDYQLQLQPTPTPQSGAVSLGVHQIAGRQPAAQTGQAAPAATSTDGTLQQFFDSALGSGTTQPSTPNSTAAPAAPSVAYAPAVSSPALAAAPAGAAAPVGGGVASYPRLSAAPAAPGSSTTVVQPAPQATPVPTPSTDATLASAQPAPPHATVTDAVSSRATTLPAVTAATAAPATAAAQADPTAARVPPAPPTRPPATATHTPVPVAAAAKPPVSVPLHPGENDLAYAGATTTIDHALASIGGTYTAVYYQPVGTSQFLVYRPGIDPPYTVPTGSWLRIQVKPGVTVNFTMYPPL